jgi:hypothetical protein
MDASTGKYLLKEAESKGLLVDAGHGVRYCLEGRDRPNTNYNWHCTIWSGKSARPVYHYLVRSEEQALKAVESQVESAKISAVYKTEQATLKKLDIAQRRTEFKVGALIVDSGGYDQTQVDFYQVVARTKSGATVTLRPICSKTVPGSEGMDCCKVSPCPDSFVGEKELKRKVGQYGVRLTWGHGSLTTEDSSHYRSWYG